MSTGKIVAVAGAVLCVVLAVLMALGVMGALPPLAVVLLLAAAFGAVALG